MSSPSPETGRYVPLSDLERWSDRLVTVGESIRDAIDAKDPELKAALQNALVTADFLRDGIRLYIGGADPTRASFGLHESQAILKPAKHLIRS